MKTLTRKLAYRLYLLILHRQAMIWLRLRARLVSTLTGKRQEQLNIFPGVFISGYEGLRLGKGISLNRDCHLAAAGGLTIGNEVSIGHGTSIITTNHGFVDPDVPIRYQPVENRPVRIGSDVWIGARVTILAGVEIADGTVIAAGAVVTKSVVEPNMIVGGVPARPLRSRFDTRPPAMLD